MTTNQKHRCAIFTRVSTADQCLSNQRAVVEQLATQRGFEITAVYEEQVSGTAAKRPELERMLSDAHAGRFDTLCIWALDRLGRSMFGNLQVVLDLDKKGVNIISVQESWLALDGPVRQLLVAVFSWVAGQEKARMVERVKVGMARARREGKHLGRPRRDLDLRHALDLRGQGLSVRAVAKEMKLSPATVFRALANGQFQKGVPESVLGGDEFREKGTREPLPIDALTRLAF